MPDIDRGRLSRHEWLTPGPGRGSALSGWITSVQADRRSSPASATCRYSRQPEASIRALPDCPGGECDTRRRMHQIEPYMLHPIGGVRSTHRIQVGDELILIRTRSPDRPNPIGVHRVAVTPKAKGG
jgi:hypothetical protein